MEPPSRDSDAKGGWRGSRIRPPPSRRRAPPAYATQRTREREQRTGVARCVLHFVQQKSADGCRGGSSPSAGSYAFTYEKSVF